MKNYKDRAELILKDAIKSAIYIDDNAREFYTDKTDGEPILEEQLSSDLFHNFKTKGISLDVHKFRLGDEIDDDLIRYFTDNRDLVLLDWKLNGQGGERQSLILLSKIIEAKHIHFCAIYTTEPEKYLDNILLNILSFFSGKTKDDYERIREELEIELDDSRDQVISILDIANLSRFDKATIKQCCKNLRDIDPDLTEKIKTITKEDNKTCSLVLASIAMQNQQQSEIELPLPSYINVEKKFVVINNTIIVILNKDKNKPKDLFENYNEQITNDVNSFNKLLGLELYNKLFKTSAILDDPFISFSKNALLHHRSKLSDSSYFEAFMNEVIIEKLSLSLRSKPLSLLDNDFLNELTEKGFDKPVPEDLRKINIFYNCLKLDKKEKTLNFGDVFSIQHDERHNPNTPKYLICISPLCDCVNPSKSKSNFYFAAGVSITLEKALKLEDTAFISYLPEDTIQWANTTNSPFSPIYIKPIQYKVLEEHNTINNDNKIEVHYLDKKGIKQTEILTYLGTIRQNYAQRIANHAFSHPMRVGIDFVKISSDKEEINAD